MIEQKKALSEGGAQPDFEEEGARNNKWDRPLED